MSFDIGMNIHREGGVFKAYPFKDIEKNIDACKDMGMDIVRYNQVCRNDEEIERVIKVSDLCHRRDMKLMLCVDSRFFTDIESLEEIENTAADFYRNMASKLGNKVDFYQIYNEIDITCMRGTIANIFLTPKDGKEKGEYDCVLWERSVAAFKGALRGMKEGCPEAKTCINFAWWHTALIYELYELGLRWDIVGIDWYSDCEEVSSIEELMNDVIEHIPDADIMICETNYWMNLHNRYPEERKEALKKDENRYKWQAEWVPEFIDTLLKINNPRLKGVIFYELLDEPIYEEDNGSYHGESHFGFIECDRYGQNRKPKPAYFALQKKCKELKELK